MHRPTTRRKPNPHARTALILARERLGLSRAELAERLGLEVTLIYRVEEGQRDSTLPILERWAAFIGAPLEIFRRQGPQGEKRVA